MPTKRITKKLVISKGLTLNKKILFMLFLVFAPSYSYCASGFIDDDNAPNSLLILPQPPIDKSPQFLSDQAFYEQGLNIRTKPRGLEATADADMSPEYFYRIFSKPMGFEISVNKTPHLAHIIDLLRYDGGGAATKTAKEKYMRERPFSYYKTHSCTPDIDLELKKNGSYPSGHASAGWVIALVLSVINPERQNEILKRGFEFGESRAICGAHWESDVEAGRIMGAALFARLMADDNFSKNLSEAKIEFKENEKK